MGSKASSSLKVKVTASLDAQLVKDLDESLKESKSRSRSQLIEDVLRKWQIEQKKRQLESEVEEYYLSLSDEELKEDRQWSKIAAQSARHLWEE